MICFRPQKKLSTLLQSCTLLLTASLLTCIALPLQAQDKPKKKKKKPVTVYAKDGSGTRGYKDTDLVPGTEWHIHDPDRPLPTKVQADLNTTTAPSDALVLFDGKNFDAFEAVKDWKILEDGSAEVPAEGKEYLVTKESFGDMQLHLEWNTPEEIPEKVGNMGNSGIFFMNLYELQIFDSYRGKNYPDGSAGAIYGETPPLVNVSKPPREWQSYDIIFTAPKFEGEKLVSPAYITVFHNGVLIQNRTKIHGPCGHRKNLPYKAHQAELPFKLQAHGSQVRFRNIWARKL